MSGAIGGNGADEDLKPLTIDLAVAAKQDRLLTRRAGRTYKTMYGNCGLEGLSQRRGGWDE